MLYNNIKHDIMKCQACPLSKELDYGCMPQWGTGSRTAKAMVLNLRTSQECHLLEKPLETKYSLLLRKILEQAKMSDVDVFVTNLLKCKCEITPARPFRENLTTCKKAWLYQELVAIPSIKVLVAMGKTTLQKLLDNKMDIDEINDVSYDINGVQVFATYSLEEIFRKGQDYMNHAISIFEQVRSY